MRVQDWMRTGVVACLTVYAAGCATPESLAVYDECQTEGLQRYPASLVDKLVRKEQKIQVPDGSSTCTTVVVPLNPNNPAAGTKTETKCTQGTRTEVRYYTDIDRVDSNKAPRDTFVSACHTQRCTERYGNPDCKMPPGATRLSPAAPAKACYVDSDCGDNRFCNNRADGSTVCQPR